MADRLDQQLATTLREGWPQPKPGIEARLQAAMSGVRPRRHPNLVTIIVVALILLVLAAAAYAAVRFLLEAKLQFSDATPRADREDTEARLLVGHTVGQDLLWETAGQPTAWRRGRNVLSPDGRKRVIQRGNAPLGFGMRWCDVCVADANGSNERNLTKAAGLGGINCEPRWSPDGTMIDFAHVDPVEGKTPCQVHHQPWVMNADGSGAHRLTPEGCPDICAGGIRWSPDSSGVLICWYTDIHDYDAFLLTAFTVDVRTNRIQVLPNVGDDPLYSPDGSQIASMRSEPGTVNGKRGFWNQLLLTNADGSDPRVLVQQFIVDATARARYLTDRRRQTTGYAWMAEFRDDAGPYPAAWSPKGNQIAFLAALPWDPKGPEVEQQVEVWVYDLRSKEAIRITHDNVEQGWVRWK